jgi:hypothetical protein
MKIEKKINISREDFAKLLGEYSRKVAEGNKITLDGIEISLPDLFGMELEYKEKHGYAKFEIEVIWDISSFGNTVKEIPSGMTATAKTTTVLPGTFKEIKKSLSNILKDIENTIRGGTFPAESNMTYLYDLINAFRQQSEPEWIPAMNKLQTSVEALIKAVETNNLSLAAEKIREINNIKDQCHQTFR